MAHTLALGLHISSNKRRAHDFEEDVSTFLHVLWSKRTVMVPRRSDGIAVVVMEGNVGRSENFMRRVRWIRHVRILMKVRRKAVLNMV